MLLGRQRRKERWIDSNFSFHRQIFSMQTPPHNLTPPSTQLHTGPTQHNSPHTYLPRPTNRHATSNCRSPVVSRVPLLCILQTLLSELLQFQGHDRHLQVPTKPGNKQNRRKLVPETAKYGIADERMLLQSPNTMEGGVNVGLQGATLHAWDENSLHPANFACTEQLDTLTDS